MEKTVENNPLVEKCMNIYGVDTVKALSKKTGVPNTTMNAWNLNGPSNIGVILLNALIENVLLKQQAAAIVESEAKKAAALEKIASLL